MRVTRKLGSQRLVGSLGCTHCNCNIYDASAARVKGSLGARPSESRNIGYLAHQTSLTLRRQLMLDRQHFSGYASTCTRNKSK